MTGWNLPDGWTRAGIDEALAIRSRDERDAMLVNCLTLYEPWASLIAVGAKRCETRSWAAPVWALGKPIAIHAAKRWTVDEEEWLGETAEACEALGFALSDEWEGDYAIPDDPFAATRGKVIAVATLVDCVRMRGLEIGGYGDLVDRGLATKGEHLFGDFGPGRYAWVLTDVRRIDLPIPARGQRGLWTVELPRSVR